MSRAFKKSEQHELAKKLHVKLLAVTVAFLSEAGRSEDVLGVDFNYNGPHSNSPLSQALAMITKDRNVVVHAGKGRRQVAYSRKG